MDVYPGLVELGDKVVGVFTNGENIVVKTGDNFEIRGTQSGYGFYSREVKLQGRQYLPKRKMSTIHTDITRSGFKDLIKCASNVMAHYHSLDHMYLSIDTNPLKRIFDKDGRWHADFMQFLKMTTGSGVSGVFEWEDIQKYRFFTYPNYADPNSTIIVVSDLFVEEMDCRSNYINTLKDRLVAKTYRKPPQYFVFECYVEDGNEPELFVSHKLWDEFDSVFDLNKIYILESISKIKWEVRVKAIADQQFAKRMIRTLTAQNKMR